jgi:succinate-acetate transporter protein
MEHRFITLLRSEGVAEAALGVVAFAATGVSWWTFVVLVLMPDLSMLGYLAGPVIGARVYNVFHSTVLPCAVAIAAVLAGSMLGVAIASVWIVHIGVDRALGYGLKSDAGFTSTHLGNLDTARVRGS